MRNLIHLSDLHIGKTDEEYNNTKQLFSFISDKYKGDFVLITGDIVDDADERQMYDANALISSLSATNTVFCAPGNHDYARSGLFFSAEAKKLWRQMFGQPFLPKSISAYEDETIFERFGIGVKLFGDIAFIVLDTADPMDNEFLARGRWTKEQSDVLSSLLSDELAGFIRVVLFHHHPFIRKDVLSILDLFPLVETMILDGADLLINALRGSCDVVLFGHKHVQNEWKDIYGLRNVFASHKSTQVDSFGRLHFTRITIKNFNKNINVRAHDVFL